MSSDIPLSVYLHLPWCERKCPYCDFNSHRSPADDFAVKRRDYLEAMRRDINAQALLVDGRDVHTVFIGGGTPSLFTPGEIAELLDALRAALTLTDDVEITMEANPGSLEREHFSGYRAAGVNRLSIGAQSMQDAALRRLGRLHTVADTHAAIRTALAAGFDRLNVDLMYALPDQTLEAACDDVAAVIDLGVHHVSHYQLTLEPNTRFFADPPALPNEDAVAEMLLATREQFRAAGLGAYEVSALAAPGHACRHNLNYWQFGDYLGIGAGAHAKLTRSDGIWRYARPAHPQSYVEHAAGVALPDGASRLSAAQLPFEFMLNALRLNTGFAIGLFESRTGLPADAILPQLRDARDRGLIDAQSDDRWVPTSLGQRFLNDLVGLFLPG
ncbi:MAG: radical SAM family heme chaperone HemW [Pseudomonadota bacterium]